jgi:hypothetical protein
MTDLIDNIVSDGFKSETPAADVAEIKETPVEAVEAESTEVEETQETEVKEENTEESREEEFPPKAKTALRHAKRQVSKFKERSERLEKEISELRTKLEAKPELKAPKEDDFTDYGSYVKAEAVYEVKKELASNQEEITKSKISELEQAKENEYIAERAAYIQQKDAEMEENYADFKEVTSGVEDIFSALPKELQKTFIDIDEGSAAFYVLAKEGKLERLLHMPSDIAKLEIVQAQYRKPAPTKQATVSKAPIPMTSVKGNASTAKPLHQRDAKELLRWTNT